MATMKEEENRTEGKEEESQDPRDRGWAWVVALAVGLLNFLLQGTLKMLGLLYLEWLVLYQQSPTATSWVGSLFSLTLTVLSPLSGYASDNYSAKNARRIVFVGGILITLCFCVAGWMNSLIGVMLIFGLGGGVLAAVIDAPILSLLSRYFMRKRSTASGIAFSCSSLGGLVLPMAIARANEEYGVRGTLVIYGGLWLNVLVISAAMIPLPTVVKSKRTKQKVVKAGGKTGEPPELLSGKTPQVELLRIQYIDETDFDRPRSQSDKQSNKPTRDMSQTEIIQNVPGKEVMKNDDSSNTPTQTELKNSTSGQLPIDDGTISSENDIQVQLSEVTQSAEDQPVSIRQASSKACMSGVLSYIKFLRTPHLLSLLAAAFFGSFAYYSQFFIIPPLAVELGMSKIMASNIIAIASVAELVGRISIGIIADRLGEKKIWITLVSTACSLIVGVVIVLNLTKEAFIGYAPFFGLFGGLFTPLVIPLTMDLVAPDRMGSAAGLVPLITGGGITLGMPILSAVYEMTSSYKQGFLICVCGNAVTLFFLIIHLTGRFFQCRKPRRIEPVL